MANHPVAICRRCNRVSLATAVRYDGMTQDCATTEARSLVDTDTPVPPAIAKAVLDAYDAERKNSVDEAQWVGQAMRALAEERDHYAAQVEESGW